jgi:gamma-glutamyltranspeptidase/glutathione hydrolase
MTAKGVVAAGHRLTAKAGAAVLGDGGNAIDAAIASLAMACVCEPVLCSPGGGGFATVRDGSTGHTSVIDFFPHTPRVRHTAAGGVREIVADFGTATQAFHIGPATTATPGFFNGIAALHAAGATQPLDHLFSPAVNAARHGVTITPFQHHLSTVVEPILTATAAAARLFAPGGSLVAAGQTVRNPGLADALDVMASDGFAGSAVGRASLELQAGRGHLTAADLDAYEAIARAPLTLRVGTSAVHMNPLPAAGGTLIAHSLAALRSVDPIDLAQALMATGKARRRAEGDLAELTPSTIRQRGTTHVSVIDGNGTACAITVSNGEGNGELVDDFGFMLNNVLGEEGVNPLGTTGWPIDTRLSSMMCPAIIEQADGGLVALGSGGSNRIRSAISQVVARLCVSDADLRTAIESPRLHIEDDHLDFEDLYGEPVRAVLSEAFPNHRAWPRPNLFFGGVHAARLAADGSFTGVGDARRDGAAIVVEARN